MRSASRVGNRSTEKTHRGIRDLCPRKLCAAAAHVAVHEHAVFEDAIERFQREATTYNVASSLLNCDWCRGHFMKLDEWEIWHTYSTYIETTHIELESFAERLVDIGVAEFAIVSSSGKTFWATSEGTGKGSTTVEVDPINYGHEFRLNLDGTTKHKPQGFAIEALGQAAQFLAGEQRVLGPEASLSPPYLRAFLGKIELVSNSDKDPHVLNLYPSVLMYETGILVIEFRMIGPDHPTELENFVASAVNLYRYDFDLIRVSPGFSREATKAYYRSNKRWPIWWRAALLYLQGQHDIAVAQKTTDEQDQCFSHQMAPLSSEEPQTLRDIAITIFQVLTFHSCLPRDGWGFLLKGYKAISSMGDYWSARPHVHLVRFDDQAETAEANEMRNQQMFLSILSRVPPSGKPSRVMKLPENLRRFDDYGAYITSASSLWVWSKQGLERENPRMDANRGNLIYERQLLVEILEYGYMLHRSLYHRMERLSSSRQIAEVRLQILDLKRRMREASHSGEIRDLLNAGWKEMSLPELRQDIEEELSIRENDQRANENLRATRVGWALTTVFGLVAVPALAEQIVSPFWHFLGIATPANTDLQKVIAVGIAILIVVPVAWLSAQLFARRPRYFFSLCTAPAVVPGGFGRDEVFSAFETAAPWAILDLRTWNTDLEHAPGTRTWSTDLEHGPGARTGSKDREHGPRALKSVRPFTSTPQA